MANDLVTSPAVQSDEDYNKLVTELDGDALLLRIKEWWGEDCDPCMKWHREAKEDFEIRAGDQWPTEDKEIMTEVQRRACLVFNQVDPVIDTVGGAEITNRQEVQYIGRQTGDAPVSEILTEAARWFRDDCEAEHEESAAFADAATCGMGWTETRLDYDNNPNGDPKIERVDPLEMFWDRAAKQANLIDARRIYRVQNEIPLYDAKAKWPTGLDGKEIFEDSDYDAGWAASQGDDNENPYNVHRGGEPRTHEGGEGSEPRYVTIVQVQWYEKQPFYRAVLVNPATGAHDEAELDEEQHTKALQRAQQLGHLYKAVKQTRRVYYRAFVGGVVLEVTQIVGPSGKNAEHFSLTPITAKWDRSKRMFYGLVRAMRGPQTFANKWLSTAVEIMARGAKGGLLLEEGAVQDIQDFENDWAKPGRNAYFKPGALAGNKVQPKPATQFPNDFMQMTQFAIASIRDVTGVNLESSGGQDQEQAASLEYQRRQSATVILAPLFDSLRRYRRIQGKMMLFLITEYLSDGRLIRITGEEGHQYIPLIHEQGVTEYDVIVDDSPSSPSQKELVWNSVVQMMPMLQNIQLPPKVMLMLLEYSPFPSSVVAKLKQAAQESGQQQGPSPMDLIMMEKKADIDAEQQKSQIKLQATFQEKQLEFQHKKRLAQIELESEIAKERIRVQGKQQEATLKMVCDDQRAALDRITAEQDAYHEMGLAEHEASHEMGMAEDKADLDRTLARDKADMARQMGLDKLEMTKRQAKEKEKVKAKQEKAKQEKAKVDSDNKLMVELLKKIATRKTPKGVRRTKDGMELIYDGDK